MRRSFPIIWCNDAEPDVFAGRLDLQRDAFVLHGGAFEPELRVTRREIVRIDHRPDVHRLLARPALRVERRTAKALVITVAGSVALDELADALGRLAA